MLPGKKSTSSSCRNWVVGGPNAGAPSSCGDDTYRDGKAKRRVGSTGRPVYVNMKCVLSLFDTQMLFALAQI